MRHTVKPTVVFTDVAFSWPDGTPVLRGVSAAFGPGRTGLIGDNGAGKTTILRLVAGDLTPTSGAVSSTGNVAFLPQRLPLESGRNVGDLLGIREKLEALRAIESGAVDSHFFETVGDDWDLEARAAAVLDGAGLHDVSLDRRVETLSGGEGVLAALAGLRLAEPSITLLDEPTNNLDAHSRSRLYDAILAWRGAILVVSHDVTLLDLMDEVAELRRGRLTTYGGSYSEYQQHLANEQGAAAQALQTAEQSLKREVEQRREAETKLARRQRYARTDFQNKRKPKVVMNQRRTEAQVSAGKLRSQLDARVTSARAAVDAHRDRLRRDPRIRIDLPSPDLATGRRVAELHDPKCTIVVQGPQRVAVTGSNGVGKTLLLETLFDPQLRSRRSTYAVLHTNRVGYLPQHLDGLIDGQSALQSVRQASPNSTPNEVRGQLARFLLRGDVVERQIGTLSGGERFRVALARLLLAQPPHELLVLDEPTNNLDLRTIGELIDSLSTYRGALIVVSHDDAFLSALGTDLRLELSEAGRLRQCPIDPGHQPADRDRRVHVLRR